MLASEGQMLHLAPLYLVVLVLPQSAGEPIVETDVEASSARWLCVVGATQAVEDSEIFVAAARDPMNFAAYCCIHWYR